MVFEDIVSMLAPWLLLIFLALGFFIAWKAKGAVKALFGTFGLLALVFAILTWGEAPFISGILDLVLGILTPMVVGLAIALGIATAFYELPKVFKKVKI